MVKSYTRFELDATFGIVSSVSSIAHIPALKGPGRAIVGAVEAIQVWDLKTSELVARLVDPQQNSKAAVIHVAYEPENELIGAGYSDGTVRVWDYRSQQVLVVFSGHRSAVSALQFTQDGTQLVSGSADTTVVVWDLVNEQGLYRLKGHKAMITGLSFLNETKLVSTAKDGVMKVWDLKTQFSIETHVAHRGECWNLTSYLDVDENMCLATVGNGTDVKLWSFDEEGEEGHQITALGELERRSRFRSTSLVFDDRKKLLLCSSGDSCEIWKLRTRDELKRAVKRKQKRSQDEQNSSVSPFLAHALLRARSKVSGMCLGAKSEVVLNLSANAIEFWSIKNEPERIGSVEQAGHRTDVRDLAISNDGTLVATGSNGQIKVYNTRTSNVVRTLADTGYVLALRFLPGDGLVVAATKEGTIDLYDIAKAQRISTIKAHEGAVWTLDLSSDGTQLVSGGADKCVKFWELSVVDGELTLKNTHKLEFADDVLAVKLSPDMKLIAASLLDSTVKVYFRDTLKFFLSLYGHQLPAVSLDISSDSKLLISSSADKNIKIWGLDFGDCHKSIFAHDDTVLKVAFEPQTHNFLSSSKDGLVKYWDGNKFVQIQRLAGHHSEVWALGLAPDGSFAVSASHDKSTRLWMMTDEPLFIEEEREQELEQQYEERLVDELENDRAGLNQDEDTEDVGEGTSVTKHSADSLKAGERLFEALDICTEDLEDTPSVRNPILAALNLAPERYLMDVLMRIKAPLVEDALLTFPLDRIVKLLKFVQIWLEKRWNLQVVCRVLFFSLRTFHKQLISNKMLQPELEEIRDLLKESLTETTDMMGFNLVQLQLIEDMWAEKHIKGFGDADEEAGTRKRVFTSA